MYSIRWPWTNRKERADQREEDITELKAAREKVSASRAGLEKVLTDLQEKRGGLNA